MKAIRTFISFLMILVVLWPMTVSAGEYDARSVILMEAAGGTVLYEENADEALPPASVTKIMTLLLVMEAVADGKIGWEEPVSVSEYAASMGGSQVYLEPGEEMSVRELVKCVTVASANDAAVALAEKVAGSEAAFVKRMNERAAQLGMTHTAFCNTNGLDDDPGAAGHVMSARDIAILSRELITKHPQILEFSSIWMDSIRDGAFGLTNTNRLIRFYRGANGLKTGSTAKAGFCISATAERDGLPLIAVVMASPTRDTRNEAAKKLLDYGFANWEMARFEAGEPDPVSVTGGESRSLALSYPEASAVITRGKSAAIEKILVIPEKISAPVTAGDAVGTVEYRLDGEVIASAPITAAESVKKLGYMGILGRFFKHLLMVEL